MLNRVWNWLKYKAKSYKWYHYFLGIILGISSFLIPDIAIAAATSFVVSIFSFGIPQLCFLIGIISFILISIAWYYCREVVLFFAVLASISIISQLDSIIRNRIKWVNSYVKIFLFPLMLLWDLLGVFAGIGNVLIRPIANKFIGKMPKLKQSYVTKRVFNTKRQQIITNADSLYQIQKFVIERHFTSRSKNIDVKQVQATVKEYLIVEKTDVEAAVELLKSRGIRLHMDLRVQDKKGVKSWAIFKGKLPSQGEKLGLKDVSEAHGSLLKNPSVISEGYGKGISVIHQEGECLVRNTNSGKELILPNNHLQIVNNEFLINRNVVVPNISRQFKVRDLSKKLIFNKQGKLNLRDMDDELVALLQSNDYVMERKYDGALYTLVIDHNAKPYLISRHPLTMNGEHVPLTKPELSSSLSKTLSSLSIQSEYKGINKLINVPGIVNEDWSDMKDSVFAVEVYSEGKGSAQTPHGWITTLLNSSPAKSWKLSSKSSAKIKLLHILSYKGENWQGKNYEDVMDIRKEIRNTHKSIHIPTTRQSFKSKVKLLEKLRKQGKEGAMLKHKFQPQDEMVDCKLKFKYTEDYPLVGIFKSNKADIAGGLLFKDKVGNISKTQGITNSAADSLGFKSVTELKEIAWNNPEKVLGTKNFKQEGDNIIINEKSSRLLELSSMQEFNSGKLRVPVIEKIREE